MIPERIDSVRLIALEDIMDHSTGNSLKEITFTLDIIL